MNEGRYCGQIRYNQSILEQWDGADWNPVPNAPIKAHPKLSGREHQIACLISDGLNNKAIGRELRISDQTVKVHLHNIYSKLELRGRVALATIVQQNHISP